MRNNNLTRRLGEVLRIVVLSATISFQTSANAANDDSAVSKCDMLMSHPHDPGRYAAGVPDDQLAPGAAIEACSEAVQVRPDLAREWFQLGRAYWAANRDSDAYSAFVGAANLHYAPAMKYIGDAYNEGRGLPEGQNADLGIAMEWYRRAADGGFPDGRVALAEAENVRQSNTFDSSIFQNPKYITRIYEGDFANIDSPIWFYTYVHAFVSELGSDKILYVQPECRPLVTEIGSVALSINQIVAIVRSMKTQDDLMKGLLQLGTNEFLADQGKRDAVALINRYPCTGIITKRVARNVVISYQEINKIAAGTGINVEDVLKRIPNIPSLK